ncbi:MAG: hypothetical protein EON58_21215, partial [Alphaproteobacteria bacterium]
MTSEDRPLDTSILSALVDRPDADELWKDLDLRWDTGRIDQTSRLAPMLLEAGLAELVDGGSALNRKGMLFAARLLLPLHGLVDDKNPSAQVGSYAIKRLISTGKNSTIYMAEHAILGNKVVLKLLRPGASEDIVGALRHLGTAELHPAIVRPIDYATLPVDDIFGRTATVDRLIFPMVEGVHFSDFVAQRSS